MRLRLPGPRLNMPKVGTLAGLNIGRKKIKFSKIKAKVKENGEDEVSGF